MKSCVAVLGTMPATKLFQFFGQAGTRSVMISLPWTRGERKDYDVFLVTFTETLSFYKPHH